MSRIVVASKPDGSRLENLAKAPTVIGGMSDGHSCLDIQARD
jgi:hypothetical protein